MGEAESSSTVPKLGVTDHIMVAAMNSEFEQSFFDIRDLSFTYRLPGYIVVNFSTSKGTTILRNAILTKTPMQPKFQEKQQP